MVDNSSFSPCCIGEDYEKVVFLYQLARGEAGGSYGLNVAALAGLPPSILRLAQHKSRQLQRTVNNGKDSGPIADIKSLLNLFSTTCNYNY
jgi:DNA mismatch repair ATPase MutS